MNRKYNFNSNYKVGMYIRLSREDGDDLESESVTNQRSLLTGFLKANGLNPINEYVDDGYSGGNFNRPGFQRLINDINQGIINMVITKDLSRLGRDHIKTGYYVENYFPEKSIRYIAVNDDIDTFYETSGSDMMPFKLSMNDMYAKDISKKVRSNLLSMKKDGKFCGSTPAYGYMRDKNDKHILVPDPDTSPVVKRIFELYVSGYGSSAIADILTKENIPTPIMLKNKSLNKCNHPEIWKHTSITNIIKNPVYIGTLVQHTTQNINYKVKKRKKVPKNDWCIKENAHEPLIKKEADFCIGSRYLDETTSEFKSTFMRRLGKNIISVIIKLFWHKKITDPTSGFRAGNKKVIEEYAKEYPSDYPEPESTVTLLKLGYKVTEKPVNMRERKAGKSFVTIGTSTLYMVKVLLAIIVDSAFRPKIKKNI